MTYHREAWDLSDIAAEKSRSWGEARLEELKALCQKIVARKEGFVSTISEKDFLSLLKDLEAFTTLEERLGEFSYLWWSENTKDPDATAFKTAVQRTCADLSNELLFLSLRFTRFPEKDIKRLIAAAPDYSYMLETLAKKKPFLLDEEREKLITLKDVNGVSKLVTVYDMITNGFTYDWDGKEVTQSELKTNVHSKDPAVRTKAYQELLKRYREHESVLGELYQGIVLDWQSENVRMRGYPTSISVRNTANDIADQDIDALLKVAEKHKNVFWKYFQLKAKALGDKRLNRFHLYAPIEKPEKQIPFEQSCEMVLDTFKGFSPVFHDLAKRMLDRKHIHSSLAPGKNQGGYCYGTDPAIDPYILINYTDDAESVSTLAHELGHAIHFMLAAEKQNVFHAHSALPVAETASIFSETLLIEKLKATYPDLYVSLAFDQLDRIYASIGRQLEFVLFERAAHAAAQKGASTTELKDLYLTRLKEHFGPEVDVPEDFANEWNYIPHIYHTPFYCYAYGFGNLLSLAAYAAWQENGAGYVDKIISMLSSGGSASPKELVEKLGFDISGPTFWEKGYHQIEKLVDDLAAHLDSKTP